MEPATPDSDEQFAEWYVWAKREVSSDPRVCLGVAQAAVEALTSGADRPSAEEAARRSVAGTAVVLLAKVSPWRRGYAQWYDWARIEFGGEPQRLHRLTRIAIQRLKSDRDAEQAAEAARSAAAADPPAAGTEPSSESSWTQGGSGSSGGWEAPFSSTASSGPGLTPAPAPEPWEAAGPPRLGGPRAVPSGPATPVTFERVAYAGLGLRLGAVAVDGVLGVVVAAVVVFVSYVFLDIAAISTRDISAAQFVLTGFAVLVILVVVFWIYDAGLESSPARGTVGKRAMRLVLIDKYGRQASFARATGRHFVKFVPLFLTVVLLYLSIPALVGGFVNVLTLGVALIGLVFLVCVLMEILMSAWTRQRQGLHDLIAGTLVVRRDSLSRIVPATTAPPPPPTFSEPQPGPGAPRPGETVPRTG
ncbi:MAG: RDD family protein [Candidatus Dormibacteraeota bacterium]|nr:RDD family protein [Candidatus Dormibacteraeota bacterium]